MVTNDIALKLYVGNLVKELVLEMCLNINRQNVKSNRTQMIHNKLLMGESI